MNSVGMIEVTGVDLRSMLRHAYRLSSPQGLGFLHARDGELDDETVESIVSRDDGNKWTALSTDYVHGRSMKFHVRRYDERLYIQRQWYDHSRSQLAELLSSVGLSPDLIGKADAEWNEHLEREVDFTVRFLKDSGGSAVESYGSPEPDAFSEHATGFNEAMTRGLVAREYSDGKSIWALTSTETQTP